MADLKISQLTAISVLTPATDVLPVVDVSGVTKKIQVNQILGSLGVASLASATITGDLTVDTSTLKVDSANNRVGIGTATPNWLLTASGSSPEFVMIDSGANGTRLYTKTTNTAVFIGANYSTSSVPINFTLDGGSSNAMTLNSTGLGVGVTPSAWGTFKAIDLGTGSSISGASSTTALGFNNYWNGSNYIYKLTAAAGDYRQTALGHAWYTAASGTAGNAITFTQAMTLDASGNLLVGTTTTSGNAGGLKLSNVSGNRGEITFSNNSGASDYVARFNYGSTPTLVGNITVSSGGTSFVTTSDYRLKESVVPLSGGLARVNALKPSTYKWKADGSNGEGFIAHELAEVVPLAVTGVKDAVNADASINPQGVDLSKVVPVLVAAIQELTARVQTLEAR
jgi:hypothetical protein